MDLNRKFHQNIGLVSRKVGDEMVIVPLRDNVADMDCVYTLNEVGAFIWETLAASKTVYEIIQEVMNIYEVDEETATRDVKEILSKMDGKIIS
jgi:hypothetical protein